MAVPPVRLATARDRDRALAGTVAAFAADPLLRWIWPDLDRYARCAPKFFGLMLDLRTARGTVWVDDAGLGASASWKPPGGLGLDPAEEERRWADVFAGFAPVEAARIGQLGEVFDPLHPREPAWYLGVLAVDPGSGRSCRPDVTIRRAACAIDAGVVILRGMGVATLEEHVDERVERLATALDEELTPDERHELLRWLAAAALRFDDKGDSGLAIELMRSVVVTMRLRHDPRVVDALRRGDEHDPAVDAMTADELASRLQRFRP